MSPYQEPLLVLNGLNFSIEGMDFQIDSLVIANGELYLYEIKNHSGHYYYRDNAIYNKGGYRVRNPLGQADRSAELLYNYLLNRGYHLKVHLFVVFIHPDFIFNDLPPHTSYLFPNQLAAHFHNLSNQSRGSNQRDMQLAQEILQLHDEYYRPKNLPVYPFDQLEKGIFCPQCFSKAHTDSRQNRCCPTCGYIESIKSAIKRNIEEYRFLFPNSPLTTNVIYEWCGQIYSRRRIYLVLKENFQSHLKGPCRYYT